MDLAHLVALASTLLFACTLQSSVDATSRADAITEASTLSYGWSTPISASATDRRVGSKSGSATNTIAGHSLRQIVNRADVRVRRDNEACVTCHSWAAWSDRKDFCGRVDAFLAMPTARDDKLDSAGAKPALLKKLLEDWRDADCPE